MAKRIVTIEDTTGAEHVYSIDAFKTLLSLSSVQNPTNVRYVSTGFSNGAPYFNSIQSAINDISAGVVIVYAGTYTENITIKDNVSVYCHRGVVLKQNGVATACVTFAGNGNLLGEAVIDYSAFSSSGNQRAIYVNAGSATDDIICEIDSVVGNIYYTPSFANSNRLEWAIHVNSCNTFTLRAKSIESLCTNSLMVIRADVAEMFGTLSLEGSSTTLSEIHIVNFYGDVHLGSGKHSLYVRTWRKGIHYSTQLVPQLWAGDGMLDVYGAYINRSADAGSFCIADDGTNSKGRVTFHDCYFNFGSTCYIVDGHTVTRSGQRAYFQFNYCRIFSSYTHIARVRYALTCHFSHCVLKNKATGAGNIAGVQSADARLIMDNSVWVVSGTSLYAIQSLDAPTARNIHGIGHCMANLGTNTDILWAVGGAPYTQTTAELAWYTDVEY